MNATAHKLIAVVTAIEGVAASVEAELSGAVGESGLLLAESVQADLAGVLEAVTSGLSEAKAVADARVNALRIESKDAILERVAGLIAGGTLSLADLTARLGITTVAPAPAAVMVVAAAAPAEVSAPAAVIDAAPVVAAAPAAAAMVDAAAIVPKQVLTAPYKNPVKFFDPTSGNGWSGRGPMPSWFAALLVDGKTKEDFRVAAAAPAAPAAEAATAAAAVVVAAPAAPAAAPAAGASAADIGDSVSFDASALEDDVAAPQSKSGDDIGEFLEDFAERTPSNVFPLSFAGNLLAA